MSSKNKIELHSNTPQGSPYPEGKVDSVMVLTSHKEWGSLLSLKDSGELSQSEFILACRHIYLTGCINSIINEKVLLALKLIERPVNEKGGSDE